MAKSKILKELANGTISIDVALKRLMIICNDLDYTEIYNWADKELNGYQVNDSVPEYRRQKYGHITYSGLKGNSYNCLKITNQPLPFHWIPKEIKDMLENRYELDSVSTIIKKSNNNITYTTNLTDIASFIDVKIAFTSILEMYDSSYYSEILSKIEQVLLKIFMKLDKEYGNLDDLDINISEKDAKERINIQQNLILIIGKMSMVNLGNDNIIKNSDIGD